MRQQRKKLRVRVKKQPFFLTDWWNDIYLSLTFVHSGTTQHSLTQLWKWLYGVFGKKNKHAERPTLYFFMSHKNLILHDPIHDLWSDPWSGPWSDPWSDPVRSGPIRSDQVRSRFCGRRKLKVTLGRFVTI